MQHSITLQEQELLFTLQSMPLPHISHLLVSFAICFLSDDLSTFVTLTFNWNKISVTQHWPPLVGIEIPNPIFSKFHNYIGWKGAVKATDMEIPSFYNWFKFQVSLNPSFNMLSYELTLNYGTTNAESKCLHPSALTLSPPPLQTKLPWDTILLCTRFRPQCKIHSDLKNMYHYIYYSQSIHNITFALNSLLLYCLKPTDKCNLFFILIASPLD